MGDVAVMNRCVPLLLLLHITVLLDAVKDGANGVAGLSSGEGTGWASYGGSSDGTTCGRNGLGLELVMVLLVPRFYLRLGPGVGGHLLRRSGRRQGESDSQGCCGEACDEFALHAILRDSSRVGCGLESA